MFILVDELKLPPLLIFWSKKNRSKEKELKNYVMKYEIYIKYQENTWLNHKILYFIFLCNGSIIFGLVQAYIKMQIIHY